MSEWPEPGLVLVYDASCGLCDAAVRFVLRHERGSALRFASLQGKWCETLLQRHPGLRPADSLILVDGLDGNPLIRSTAVLAVAAELRLPWRLLVLLRWVPRRLRDWAYDVVARGRHRLQSAGACRVPGPDLRGRFLG